MSATRNITRNVGNLSKNISMKNLLKTIIKCGIIETYYTSHYYNFKEIPR